RGNSVSVYPLGDDFAIANNTVIQYVTAPGLGVVAKRVGGQTFWVHGDRLGSIQTMTDASGGEVERRSYRPWGETINRTGSQPDARGWIGERQDDETALVFLHARYYDPAWGLFLSPDPVSPALPGVGTNRYAYGLNNPISWTDRSGLISD